MQSNIGIKAKEYFKKLEVIKNINRGGCLFSAYGVYLRLEKDGFDMSNVNIVQLSISSLEDIEYNKSFLAGNTQNAGSSSHFALSVDGGKTFLDAMDMVNAYTYDYHLLIPSSQVEVFSENCLRNGSWNATFERNVSVPKINEILGISLKY